MDIQRSFFRVGLLLTCISFQPSSLEDTRDNDDVEDVVVVAVVLSSFTDSCGHFGSPILRTLGRTFTLFRLVPLLESIGGIATPNAFFLMRSASSSSQTLMHQDSAQVTHERAKRFLSPRRILSSMVEGMDGDREKGSGDGVGHAVLLLLLVSTSSICIRMDIPRRKVAEEEDVAIPP